MSWYRDIYKYHRVSVIILVICSICGHRGSVAGRLRMDWAPGWLLLYALAVMQEKYMSVMCSILLYNWEEISAASSGLQSTCFILGTRQRAESVPGVGAHQHGCRLLFHCRETFC